MGIPRAGNAPPEPPSGALGAAAVDVQRGMDGAAQLAALLRGCPGQEQAGGLAEEVLASLSRALASLDSYAAAGLCRGPPAVEECTAGPSEPLEGSGERRKVQAAGGRRRSQTRSRRSQPYGCKKVVARQLEDGYTWRKYGQKEIHGFKYPRCYFRCTHKYDQGCQAIRQVQKSEEDPSALLITYLGDHTCKEAGALLHPAAAEPFVINFAPPTPAGGGRRGPPATFSRMMPETGDGPVGGQRSPRDSAGSSSPTYLMLPELTPLGASAALPERMSSTDNLDTAPSWFVDADDSVESLPFEGMLGLDHYDFAFVSP